MTKWTFTCKKPEEERVTWFWLEELNDRVLVYALLPNGRQQVLGSFIPGKGFVASFLGVEEEELGMPLVGRKVKCT